MSRPILFVCRRCESKRGDGDALFRDVKAIRKALGLKPLFRVEGVKCLDECDSPCAIKLKGPKRSTYTRTHVAPDDATALVEAAVAYAALEPGEELSERRLPGESAD